MIHNFWRLGLLTLSIALVSASMLSADIIYTIADGSNFGDNGLGTNTPPAPITDFSGANSDFVDNMDGTFTLITVDGAPNNTNTFISSAGGNINTLLGTPLTATDVVTVRGTIDNINGNLNANGIELGLSSLLTTFRGDPSLLIRYRPDGVAGAETELANGFNGLTVNVNNAGPGVTEASVLDGFSYTAVYDAAGITYTISDISERGTGNPTQTVSLTAADILAATSIAYDFENSVGNSFAYFGFQTGGTGVDRNATISEFSIDVTSTVPEPSSVALMTLFGAGFFTRRRRR